MQNMWNSVNNNFLVMGHNPMFGPSTTQKRQFGFDFPNVANISVGKYFNNPNFVNKDYPRIHNYGKTVQPVQPTSACQFDTSKSEKPSFSEAPFINSSQSIIETIKEKHLDIVRPVLKSDLQIQTVTDIPCQNKQTMCKKRTRKNRRPRKGHCHKNPGKGSKTFKKEINEMMDIDFEPHNINLLEISNSPKEHHSLMLSDFLCNKNSYEKGDADFATDEEDTECDLPEISNSPKMDYKLRRERTVSLAESEDSFIVFESGTDDELEFSDNSQEEDESEEDTDEGESDSSPSVVPRKKVSKYH